MLASNTWVLSDSDLAVKVMQTYADFTIGGSISVNCNGRYIGLHQCPREKLADYIQSIRHILWPVGYFILHYHDAASDKMKTFFSLILYRL